MIALLRTPPYRIFGLAARKSYVMSWWPAWARTMHRLKRTPNCDLQLVSVNDARPPPYTILSHTWSEGQEVTYDELVTGTGKHKTGYDKILFCVDRAAEDGVEYCWVDTCCIDKSSQQELQTAINSMFRWYQGATSCYAYLSDVQVPKEVSDAQAFPIS